MSTHLFFSPLPRLVVSGGLLAYACQERPSFLALGGDGNNNTKNNNDNHCLLSIYYVPDTQLRTLHFSPGLILPEVLGGKCAFPDGESEAQGDRQLH